MFRLVLVVGLLSAMGVFAATGCDRFTDETSFGAPRADGAASSWRCIARERTRSLPMEPGPEGADGGYIGLSANPYQALCYAMTECRAFHRDCVVACEDRDLV